MKAVNFGGALGNKTPDLYSCQLVCNGQLSPLASQALVF